MIAVHGPHTWGHPFYAQSENIYVNLLGPYELEFKSPYRGPLEAGDPFIWDFGDGTPVVNGYEVTHTFAQPGTFVVRLTINTPDGPVTDQIEITLSPNGAEEEPSEEETTPRAA